MKFYSFQYLFCLKMVDYLKKALIYGHTSRIDMPPPTLPAQPPAHSIETGYIVRSRERDEKGRLREPIM